MKTNAIYDGASVLTLGWGQTSDGKHFKTINFYKMRFLFCT
jgi:hypothetical protein